MSGTIFSKIIKGEIPCDKVYEDDNVLAFKDINPIAEIHLLFIHKKETKDIVDMAEKDDQQFVDLFQAIAKYTKESGLYDKGFRLMSNVGASAGQSVFHTHFHVLSGKGIRSFH